MAHHYIAIDLGAESGRVMLGSLDARRLGLEEIHRFANVPLRPGHNWHWNFPALWSGIKEGLHQVARRQIPIASVSVDSWGLDCVLLDAEGEVMPPVFHYRDPRTARGVETLFAKVPWEAVFAETGIQFMPFNHLYHLAAEAPERLAHAAQIIPLGDTFNHLLGGMARAEVSLASTTQLFNPRTRMWSAQLLAVLGIGAEKFPPLVEPGTRLGRLKPQVASETGLSPSVEIIATCTHDTGAAVAGVPVGMSHGKRQSPDWAYLSSGTWSLLGLELDEPVLTDHCRELNFTNELGFGSSVRLLKNIVGLWLVQECRRAWEQAGQPFDYPELTQRAAEAEPFRSLINPSGPRFAQADAMPARIAAFCHETRQPSPDTPGQFIRCVLESLALEYHHVLHQAELLTGASVARLHIVGGGSKNALLNQFTANACKIPVIAGPTEATAIGNVLVQAIALGHLPSLAAGRELVAASFATTRFDPSAPAEWEAAAARFAQLR